MLAIEIEARFIVNIFCTPKKTESKSRSEMLYRIALRHYNFNIFIDHRSPSIYQAMARARPIGRNPSGSALLERRGGVGPTRGPIWAGLTFSPDHAGADPGLSGTKCHVQCQLVDRKNHTKRNGKRWKGKF